MTDAGRSQAEDRPAQRHHLRATVEAGRVLLRIVCESPEGAWCRVTCEDWCESYGPDHPHELVSTDGYCNAVEWIEGGDMGVEESYVGEPVPLVDGMAVKVTWEGDYYSWSATADASRQTPDTPTSTSS